MIGRRGRAPDRGRQETLFEDLLECAPDAMVVVDRAGRIVIVNGQAERLFGYPRADLVGEPIEKLVPDGDRQRHRAHRDGYLAAPSARPMGAGLDLQGRRADGTEIPVDISLSAAGEGDGQLTLAAIRDVTEARRVAEEMRCLTLAAERANEAKSEFLSRMSHELRTPLNAIIGFGQVLLMKEPQEESPRRDGLGQILAAGRHLLSLINEMLDMARIEAGKIELSLEPVRLGDVVEQAVDLVAPQASARRISVEVDAGTIAPTIVLADQQRLLQVLVNLLGNGVKYNHAGGAVAVAVAASGDGDRVRVLVRDTGPGIDPADVERVFEPFERVAGPQDGVEGTGLGLALSRRLVEAMGGTIHVETAPGAGSTFVVDLARGIAAVPARGEAARQGRAAGRHTVLYVEDNLVSQRLVERVLEPLGDVEVVVAGQGSLGVEVARRRRPDVILLDLHLPDMGGRDVLGRLKDDAATRDIPVVVLSAAHSRALERELLAAGAAAFLAKPFDTDVLVTVVDELLARR